MRAAPRRLVLLGLLAGTALAASCAVSSRGNGFGGQGAQGGDAPGTTSGELFDGGLGGTGGSGNTCVSSADQDLDQDGWTLAQGDCNDCDPNVNPGAVDTLGVPDGDGGMTEPFDNDCDGQITAADTCDDLLALDDPDPMRAAAAVDLCKPLLDPMKWGVVSAKWTMPNGSPAPADPSYHLGHGLLPAFGPNVHVQRGKRMLALSSGTARQPADPGYQSVGGFDKGYTANSPPGFPKESPACPGVITGQPHDAVALEVTLLAPTNAHGFSFDFAFFTYEWPTFVCSTFNDFFIALLSPIPAGQPDGNISFDSKGNPVSVNNAFVEVCGCGAANPPPAPGCLAGTKQFTCALGDDQLLGTGFGKDLAGADHASTGWLSTKAPIGPHEQITVRWTVYDSGDGKLDTTTLVDNWQWIAATGTTVGTNPIGTPK